MKTWFQSEDGLALAIGLVIFVLALAGIAGVDLLGWAVATREWVDPRKALAPISAKTFTHLSGEICLLLTGVFLLVLMTLGAMALRLRLSRFTAAFLVVFA